MVSVVEPSALNSVQELDLVTMECFDFLGIPLRNIGQAGLVSWVIDQATKDGSATGYAINAHSVNLALRDSNYMAALRRADVVYCDGISVLWGARSLGYPLCEKVTTTDVLNPICERAANVGLSMYILGNPPGIAEEAGRRLSRRFKGLNICGTHSGYFEEGEEERVVEEIRRLRPRILWVGMGNPIQELWVERFRDSLEVPVILTCGGMMEIVAGHLQRPPQWWTDHGGEWFYRLMTQPRRTWKRYLLGNPRFLAHLVQYRLSARSYGVERIHA